MSLQAPRTAADLRDLFAHSILLETKNRTEEEKEFFIVHGCWPETPRVGGRAESTFTTHGLKTTIILERTGFAETSCNNESAGSRRLMNEQSEIEICLEERHQF